MKRTPILEAYSEEQMSTDICTRLTKYFISTVNN